MLKVKLKVMVGSNAGKEIPVPVSRFLIGRSDECHLRPKSDAISRNHCTILVSDEDVAIRDLNSRNGTYVNGERITQDHALVGGERLQIGKLEFEVVVDAPKKAASEQVKKPVADSASIEFDITSWLEEGDTSAKAKRQSDPDTRQFKLDETDRIALEQAAAAAGTPSGVEEKKADSQKIPTPSKTPGKLPERPKAAASSSREVAADMLKKFFNNK